VLDARKGIGFCDISCSGEMSGKGGFAYEG
jgi:hypothetical protein